MSIWQRVNTLFSRKSDPQDTPDRRNEMFATAMLLLEASYADFDIEEAEVASARQCLADIYAVSDDKANEVIKEALTEHPNATSMHPYLLVLNKNLSNDEKEKLLQGLWEVTLADQQITPHEEQRMRKLTELLYIPHSSYIRVKNRVLENR